MTRKRIITDPTVRPDAPARARGAKGGVTHAEVRELALALPEAEEKPSYGTPGFKVKNKLFARLREDGETLVVKVSFDQRKAMLAQAPETFVVTPHYQDHPMVLVVLKAVDRELLREVLAEAWRLSAPPSVLKRVAAAQAGGKAPDAGPATGKGKAAGASGQRRPASARPRRSSRA